MKIDLTSLVLLRGKHDKRSQGVCALEAVAGLAGEKHSDRPKCACPVVSAFVRSWNDRIRSDEERTRLLTPLLPILVGSRSTRQIEIARGWAATDWAVRDSAAAWLAFAVERIPALQAHADALRALAPIVDRASLDAARPVIAAAREAACKDRSAAYAPAIYVNADAASASAAAVYAAVYAAASAAYAAYASAASAAYAASAASASAAYAASASAAYAASAASAAYRKRLDAFVAERQASAQDLVRKLCAMGAS